LPAFAKSAILGPSLALLLAKYKRQSGEENKKSKQLMQSYSFEAS